MDCSSMASEQLKEQLSQDIELLGSVLQGSGEEWSEEDSESDNANGALLVDTDAHPEEDSETEAEEDNTLAAGRRVSQTTVFRQQHKNYSSSGLITPTPAEINADNLLSEAVEGGQLKNNPETCLALNRAYQEILYENMKRVELVLADVRERQALLSENIEDDAQSRVKSNKKLSLAAYFSSYFKDSSGHCPPPNEDTEMKRASGEIDPSLKPPKIWTELETQTLKDAVKNDCLQRRLRSLMVKKEHECQRLVTSSAAEGAVIRESIKRIDSQMEVIREMSTREIIGPLSEAGDVDWLKISAVDLKGARSPWACEALWVNALHPETNTGKWRSEEDEALGRLAQQHGGHEWEQVAAELETGRTAFQCLQRYQAKLNPCLHTGKWAAEEDDFLKEVVSTLTKGTKTPWAKVAVHIEGRSAEQCESRWKLLSANDKYIKGKWTAEEDEKLILAVARFGINWTLVERCVITRSAIQCRERYANALDKSVRSGRWSYAEDKHLWQLAQQYGPGHWAKFATHMEGRTDNACLQRYRKLTTWRAQEQMILSAPGGRTFVRQLLDPSRLRTVNHELQPATRALKREVDEGLGQARKEKAELQRQVDLNLVKENKLTKHMEALRVQIAEAEKRQKETLETVAMDPEVLERLEAMRADAEEALADRAQGIEVPRQLMGLAHMNRKLVERGRLRESVKKKVMKALIGIHKPDPSGDIQVNVDIDLQALDENSRVSDILKATKKCIDRTLKEGRSLSAPEGGARRKAQKGGRKGDRAYKLGRPRGSAKKTHIDLELAKSMGLRTTKVNCGRPKKIALPSSGSNTQCDDKTRQKVACLLARALSCDMKTAVLRARALTGADGGGLTCPGTPEIPWKQPATPARNPPGTQAVAAVAPHPNLPNDIALVELITGATISAPGVHRGEGASCPPSTPRGMAPSHPGLVTPSPCRRVGAPPPGSPAQRVPRLPLLPPTVASTRALRELLLGRRRMERRASYSVPRILKSLAAAEAAEAAAGQEPGQRFPGEATGAGHRAGDGALTVPEGVQISHPSDITMSTLAVSEPDGSGNNVIPSNAPGMTVIRVERRPHVTLLATATPGEMDTALGTLGQGEGGPGAAPTRVCVVRTVRPSPDGGSVGGGGGHTKELLLARGPSQEAGLSLQDDSRHDHKRQDDKAESKTPERPKEKGPSPGQRLLSTIHQSLDYQLLKARFKAIFTWPALLSATPPIPPDTPAAKKRPTASTTGLPGKQKSSVQEPRPGTSQAAVSSAGNQPSPQPARKKKIARKYPCSRGKSYRTFTSKSREEKKQIKSKLRYKGSAAQNESDDVTKGSQSQDKASGSQCPDIRGSKEGFPSNGSADDTRGRPGKRRKRSAEGADRRHSSRLQDLDQRRHQEYVMERDQIKAEATNLELRQDQQARREERLPVRKRRRLLDQPLEFDALVMGGGGGAEEEEGEREDEDTRDKKAFVDIPLTIHVMNTPDV